MTSPDEIKSLILKSIADAVVEAKDTTGTGDHFQVTVVSKAFQGKSLIEQHQLVNEALKEPLEDGRIHALQIKTQTATDETLKEKTQNDFKIIQ
jgi:stress-induced morphogen